MLTPEQIEAVRLQAEELTRPVVEFLIEDIARRISEAGQLTSTAQYQIWRAQNLGLSQKEIQNRLKKLLNVSEQQIKDLLTQTAKVGYRFDLSRLPTVDAIPFEENTVIQQIVSAAVELAQADFSNITQTLGFVNQDGVCRPLTDAWLQACDFAFEKVATGAEDMNSAVRKATKYLADKGIRTIDYESGVHRSIEAATRGCVMGGLGLMQEKISQYNHDELGANGWEISAHAASAPDHEPIQGKQYSDEEYEKLNNALARRIGTLNCGHAAFPVILGVSKPQYTDAELEQFKQDNAKGIDYEGQHYSMYEATQQQRKLERTMRKQKNRILVDETNGDKEKLQVDQIRLRRISEEYNRFSKAAGLRTQPHRAQVAGFGVKQAGAAQAAAQRHHTEWLHSIGAENSELKKLDKYYEAKYNNSPAYQLLMGYRKAVDKGDISPLVGIEEYIKVANNIQAEIIGQTTSTGITIESYATHFIDRVIGQTSEAHEGKRCGVSIENVLDALLNPIELKPSREFPDGDIRQNFVGKKAKVTISIRDKRLIQTNPWKGG
ncbi:MAG: phage minor capsid protein [Clostridia bacterium]|nr:phage minor capsid protein [Clostridia bacterium]